MTAGTGRARRAGLTAGLACLWLCLQCDIFFPLTLVADVAGAGGYSALEPAHAAFVLAAALAGWACGHFGGALGRAFRARPLATCGAACALGLASSLLLAWPQAESAALLAGGALSGAWLALAVALYVGALAGMRPEQASRALLAGFGLAALLMAAAGLAGVPKQALVMPCPALAGLLAACGAPSRQDGPAAGGGLTAGGGSAAGRRAAGGRPAAVWRPAGASSARALPFDLLAPSCALAVCATVSVRMMSASPSPSSGVSGAVTALCSLAILAVMTALIARMGTVRAAHVALFAALAVTLALGCLLSVVLEEAGFPLSPRRFIVAAEHCLELYMMGLVALSAGQRRLSPWPCAAVFLALGILLPRLAACDLAELLAWLGLLSSGSHAAVAMGTTFVVFGVTVGSLLALMRRQGGRGAGRGDLGGEDSTGGPGDNGGSFLDPALLARCERMGRACGLSQREVEVACLLAEGRPQKEIAERMSVAPSTVKTHVKHVYAKLAVHSRQELAEVIDSYDDGSGTGADVPRG